MKPVRNPVQGTTEHSDTVDSIVGDYLQRLRRQFYPDSDKQFFQQRKMLMTGLTFPAAWLKKRGVTWSPRRYREMLDEVILGIQRHGSTAQIGFFPRYFLHCIQQHMKHNEEAYYDLGKSHRDKMQTLASQFVAGLTVQDTPADPIDDMARLNSLLKSQGGRRKKQQARTPPAATQQTLF